MSRFVTFAVVLATFSGAGCLSEPVGPASESSSDGLILPSFQAAGRPVQVSCGQVITQSIALANDLTNCVGNGLVVGADGIVIDGRGHVVDAVLNPTLLSYGILVEGRTGVTIRNITVREFTIGVGLLSSTDSRVTHSTIELNDLDGVLLMAAHGSEISHNDFTGNGIAVNLNGSNEVNIEHNRIVDPRFGNAIQLTGAASAEVISNRIQNGGLNLQTTTDSRLERNRIEGAVLFGLSIRGPSRRNVLRNNDVSGVSGDGFSIFGISAVIAPSDNTLIGNRASGNTGDGFRIFGAAPNHSLSRNASEGNGGFGFRDATSGGGTAGTANTYDRNRCEDNVAGASTPAGLCSSEGEGL